ncbi:MAG: alpha/beta hydrolase [Planctomycetota bacterium]|nr:alpha/beta hydrolase [Planctomycetota bacterium]
MARHWIITNREVGRKRENGHFVERVTDDRREPLPVFRIGQLDLSTGATPTIDEMHRAVELVEDDFVQGYDALAPDENPERLAGSARLFLSLYQQMTAPADPKKGDTLFFLHGFNYSWEDALEHLLRLHRVYVEPPESPIGQILYFTWPSYGSSFRYPSDQKIAQPSGTLLGRVFGKAVRFYQDFFRPRDGQPAFCGRKIHFAAHSMGNQVAQEFIRSIWDYEYLRMPMFGEVLLLNADLEWTGLEKDRPLHDLPEYCTRIHVYNHTGDNALGVSESTKNDGKRLGKYGPRDIDATPPRLVVADCSSLDGSVTLTPGGDPDQWAAVQALARADGRPFLATAERITRLVGSRERLFDHWGYLHRPEVVADIYKVLRGVSSSHISTREQMRDRLFRLKPIAR